jgi:hypothetical protein
MNNKKNEKKLHRGDGIPDLLLMQEYESAGKKILE